MPAEYDSLFGKLIIEPEVIRMLLFGLALMLMMLFRPDGFIPAARSKQVKKAEQQVLASQEVTE